MGTVWTVYYKTKSTHAERHKDFTSLPKAVDFFYKQALTGGAKADPLLSSAAMYGSFVMTDLPWYYLRKENMNTAGEYISQKIKGSMK